jgi:hypothetical protein
VVSQDFGYLYVGTNAGPAFVPLGKYAVVRAPGAG